MIRRALVAAVAVLVAALATGCAQATPERLELTGDLLTHDPALVAGEGDEPWYAFSTGGSAGDGNVQIRSSPDGRAWRYVGEVWTEKPEWIAEAVPGVQNLWAPEVIEHDGTWYLYYSASTFGSNHSVIALATNSTLDPSDPDYEWVDQGAVMASEEGDNYNAIDPGIVVDGDGTPWMSFGSFWGGIHLVELEWPSGLRADEEEEPLRIADRREPPNAIEAPYIVERDGWFYLFVSFDSCCRGLDSTYRIAVGRSQEVAGPYVDREGRPLLEGGGTILLESEGDEIGPGGQSVSADHLAYHYYDGSAGGQFRLAITRLGWDAEGWPVVP